MKKDNKKKPSNSRRNFLKKATLAAGSLGAMSVFGFPNDGFLGIQKEMKTKRLLKIFLSVLFIGCIISPISIYAQTEVDEAAKAALAKKSQNPVGNMISAPIEYWHYGNVDNTNGANVIMLKPVYPVTIGKFTLINRLIVPMVGISANSGGLDLGEISGPFPNGKTTGLSNIQYQGFFTKADPGKVIIGLGPVIELPTNTSGMGSSQWSAGPALVILTMPGKWVLGALAQNIWSFAGPDDDSEVNQLVFQYFVNYNFNKGWYVTSTPILTADWNKESDNQWTVPVGGGVGRLVRLGKLPVDFKIQAFSHVVRPDVSPGWSMLFAIKFLFPK